MKTESSLPIPRTTVTEIVREYHLNRQRIGALYDIVAQINGSGMHIHLEGYGQRYQTIRLSEPEQALKALDLATWRTLVDKMELRRLLSVKRNEELTKAARHRRRLPGDHGGKHFGHVAGGIFWACRSMRLRSR